MKRQHPDNPDLFWCPKLGWFKKGNIPWNKGTKGLTKQNSGSFRKGMIPHNKISDNIARPTTRVCRKCNKEKVFNNFTKDKTCTFGRSHTCKKCTSDNMKERYGAGLCYQKKGRNLLSVEQKQANRRQVTKTYRDNMGVKVKEREREHGKKNQSNWAKALHDNYVKKSLYSAYGLNAVDVTLEMIELKRQQLIMCRNLKQFKQWREQNESSNPDVQGKQHSNESNHERPISA